ncbi:DinB family protein [Aureibacter tunicatorum]|uniref:DinB family protein n=1 Tax=Aureibacter tunicatorum TaxID=866807 RepID=A0AAE4BQW8_9BACT|nr:DinB family protein [Aureibacter tunicatorum]MDR6238031.1 hypothetical protein [Aureibacter tunicatorum]BDD03064.1 hypothetical protein AUTU_05470 [Aureibacter tunicatorum]
MDKKFLFDSVIRECEAIAYISKNIKEEYLAYRPAESMWSTQELMETLSFIGIYTAEALYHNDFKDKTHDRYYRMVEKHKDQTISEYLTALDDQKGQLIKFFETIKPEDLKKRVAYHPLIDKLPLGIALQEITIKFLTGYKMQLFVYLKTLGEELIGANLWSAKDSPFYSYE